MAAQKSFKDISNDFMRNVKELLADLKEMVQVYPELKVNSGLITLGEIALGAFSSEGNLVSYIETSHTTWIMINEGIDEILSNEEIIKSLFGKLPDSLSKVAVSIFTTRKKDGSIVFSTEDQEDLLAYFSNLVRIGIKGTVAYRREKRADFMPEIDIDGMCKVWKVKGISQ